VLARQDAWLFIPDWMQPADIQTLAAKAKKHLDSLADAAAHRSDLATLRGLREELKRSDELLNPARALDEAQKRLATRIQGTRAKIDTEEPGSGFAEEFGGGGGLLLRLEEW
jgi:hypothetical protein